VARNIAAADQGFKGFIQEERGLLYDETRLIDAKNGGAWKLGIMDHRKFSNVPNLHV